MSVSALSGAIRSSPQQSVEAAVARKLKDQIAQEGQQALKLVEAASPELAKSGTIGTKVNTVG